MRPAGQRVFDFHARLVPRPRARQRLLDNMDAAGIDRAAVAAGGVLGLDQLSRQLVEGGHCDVDADNDAVLSACEDSGGRLVPFYFANPRSGVRDYRRRCDQFRGLELSPAVHGVGLADRRTLALVEVAAEAGHPVYVVSTASPGSRTADLVTLATAFAEVCFVFGHCGFTGIDAYGIGQIAGRDNILAETSGCLTVLAQLAMQRLGHDRVLFGTEYPLQHPRVELAKFAALDLAPQEWEQVAWLNAHRLLGEETS